MEKLKTYYQIMIDKTNNPKHKDYYLSQLKLITNGKPEKSKTFEKIKVYSSVLNMHFDSVIDASFYVGKSQGYVSACLSGRLKNKYGFQKL